MTNTLRDQMESDIDAVFLNTDDFAEPVTVIPENGPERTISAVVDEKMAPRNYEQQHKTVTRRIEVFVKKDAVTGIVSVGDRDKLRWDGVVWSDPKVLYGDAFAQTIQYERKTIESVGRQRSGTL